MYLVTVTNRFLLFQPTRLMQKSLQSLSDQSSPQQVKECPSTFPVSLMIVCIAGSGGISSDCGIDISRTRFFLTQRLLPTANGGSMLVVSLLSEKYCVLSSRNVTVALFAACDVTNQERYSPVSNSFNFDVTLHHTLYLLNLIVTSGNSSIVYAFLHFTTIIDAFLQINSTIN